MELKYDSLYSGLVSINRSLGGYQPMPDSEYGAMIDLMETLSNRPVGESGDVFDAVSTVATMAENGELPIQGGGTGETKVNVLSNGVKFGYSTFSSVPSIFDFSGEWTDTSSLFHMCQNLTSVPYIDTKMVTDMSNMFNGCESLTLIPELDFSNMENCAGIFSETGLTSFGDFVAPKCTNMNNVFGYSAIEEIGNIDVPLVTRFSLSGMDKLKRVGSINVPSVTSLQSAFYNCKMLESAPNIDTTNVTSFSQIFYGCSALTSIPVYNTSKVTDFYSAFKSCTSLVELPQWDFSGVVQASRVQGLIQGCTSLTTIPELDFSNIPNSQELSIFGSQTSMPNITTLGGFKGLKNGFQYLQGLDAMPNLTVESIMNVFDRLYDFVSAGEEPRYETATMYLGDNYGKLTEEQIAVATNKGWVVVTS